MIQYKRVLSATGALLLIALPLPAATQGVAAVFDVHLHALPADHQGPPPLAMCAHSEHFPAWDPRTPYTEIWMADLKHPKCEDPIWSPESDDALMKRTIEIMEKRNVYGVLSGSPELVARWREAASHRFMPGLVFQLGNDAPTPTELETMHEDGRLEVLGEVINQYAGIAPNDSRMEPYWDLAERLDIPVGIHVGTGPPGAIYLGASGYRARLHSPLTLEEVLVRHPKLRVYVMHAGFPMLDDMLAVLYAHPQVYVGTGVIGYTQPRSAFYRYLKTLVEAGFGKRVMFGSDQMIWPEAIERSIVTIEEARFLSEQQKRDILYNNAARFLRLSEEEKARHRLHQADSRD